MPANYAHHRFGKQILKAMPGEARQCAQRFRRLFDAGLHGPNIFFYFNPFWKTSTGDLGAAFHAMSGRDFFSTACKAADSEAARAYLYGLLAHYCLDSACHPFVNTLDSVGEARHMILESEFDRFLLVLDGQAHPETYDMSKKLRLTRGECVTVSGFYPGTTGGRISRSVRSMASGIRYLAKPGREKLLKKLGLSFADNRIPARENEELSFYVSELKALYDEALDRYPRMLEALEAHMATGEALGADFGKSFG